MTQYPTLFQFLKGSPLIYEGLEGVECEAVYHHLRFPPFLSLRRIDRTRSRSRKVVMDTERAADFFFGIVGGCSPSED